MAFPDPPTPDAPRALSPWVRRMTAGLIAGCVAAASAVGLAVLPVPFVRTLPGPTVDVLEDDPPFIDIEGAASYPPAGDADLSLVTVSIVGGPGRNVGLLPMLRGTATPDEVVRLTREVYPESDTIDQVRDSGAQAMSESQVSATAAALGYLDIPYTIAPRVDAFVKGGRAKGVLEVGDVLTSIAGYDVSDMESVRRAGEGLVAGEPVVVKVRDGDGERSVRVTPFHDDDLGRALLGVMISSTYDFPIEVEFASDDIGGPSAGLVFALAITDLLTPGELVGDGVAGTGTMAADGSVGAIGSVALKMRAAKRDGASWFLAPLGNCDDITAASPVAGLRVVPVRDLDQAVSVLERINDGDTSQLPACGGDGL